MNVNIKSAIAGALAALMLAVVPLAQADDDRGHWKHGWKHNHHYRHDHHRHWGHRHDHDRVVVIREPRYVYRERAYVVEEPYYPARRPSVVVGVNVPPLVIGF